MSVVNKPKPTPEGTSDIETIQQNPSEEILQPPEKPKLVSPFKTALNTGVQAGLSGALAMSLQVQNTPTNQ